MKNFLKKTKDIAVTAASVVTGFAIVVLACAVVSAIATLIVPVSIICAIAIIVWAIIAGAKGL